MPDPRPEPRKHHQKPRLTVFARKMRKDPSVAEHVLWQLLRRKNLHGLRFRRQQPLGPFIADFFCAQSRTVIELDGDFHINQVEADLDRENWIREQGLDVLRYASIDVIKNREGVLSDIYNRCVAKLERLTPPPSPLPQGEGE